MDQWEWHRSDVRQLAIKIRGMLELTENGKIIEWREYYSSNEWTRCGGQNLMGRVCF